MSDKDLLCVGGLQHCFTLSAWDTYGATSHWASEMLCPTCGTTISRDEDTAPWRWNPPDDA